MPELPEVETVRLGLAPVMTGANILEVEQRRPNLRFPFPDQFAERLKGRTIKALARRAKYLLADIDCGTVLVMHLGMSGSFRIIGSESAGQPGRFHHDRSKDEKHDHVVFQLSNGHHIIYNDPRRFGFMDLIPRNALAEHPLFAKIGMEPLGNQFGGSSLAAGLAGKTAPLKAALLDQTIIAGLGNIYVCEALFRSGLSPRRKAGTLVRKNGAPTDRAQRLADNIQLVLKNAIAAGGSSLRDHRQTDGTLGYFQHTFQVYDREGDPCPNTDCQGTIKRIVQAGRSTFFCPVCQK